MVKFTKLPLFNYNLRSFIFCRKAAANVEATTCDWSFEFATSTLKTTFEVSTKVATLSRNLAATFPRRKMPTITTTTKTSKMRTSKIRVFDEQKKRHLFCRTTDNNYNLLKETLLSLFLWFLYFNAGRDYLLQVLWFDITKFLVPQCQHLARYNLLNSPQSQQTLRIGNYVPSRKHWDLICVMLLYWSQICYPLRAGSCPLQL